MAWCLEQLADRRPLSPAQDRAFDWHARRLGHDPDRLRGDTELVTYPHMPSVAALRTLAAATPEQRRRRQRVFFGPSIAIRRGLGQGIHDRLEAAVFAAGQIGPADEAWASRHFPFPTRVLSVRYRHVRADLGWDLSVRGEHWGLDDRDDIMNVVNIGSLQLAPGTIVTVRGNLLILVVQRLICDDADGGAPCQLAFLPTPYSVDSGTGPLHGVSGPAGTDGPRGADGVPTLVAPTWLGPRLTGPVEPAARDGADGGAGAPGGDGAKGRTGGASKIAEITIGELDGSLTIFAAAGRGGDGGSGGDGGHGGPGGHGAPAQRTLQGVLPSGRSGDGGPGGDGGQAGRGGNGGISSNIFVSLPRSAVGQLRVLGHPSAGGRGGRAGLGGRGGLSGRPGRSGHDADADSDSDPGRAGADGTHGRDGRPRPAPPVFVNELLAEPVPVPAEVPPPGAVRSLDTRRGAPPTEGERQ